MKNYYLSSVSDDELIKLIEHHSNAEAELIFQSAEIKDGDVMFRSSLLEKAKEHRDKMCQAFNKMGYLAGISAAGFEIVHIGSVKELVEFPHLLNDFLRGTDEESNFMLDDELMQLYGDKLRGEA